MTALRLAAGNPEPRIPPQAISAEQAVLGGLLLNPASIAKLTLTESDFYRRDHQQIFRAVRALDAKASPVDVVTVGDWLRAHDLLTDNGAYLTDLAATTPGASNITAYAEIVADKSRLRQAIDAGSSLVHAAFKPEGADSGEVIDAAIRSLMALVQTKQDCDQTLKQAMLAAWDDVQQACEHPGDLRGVTTGLARMDKRLGGWHSGDLIFIGARPSMGKTALMVNMALAAAKAGHVVGVVSGEQSAMQIGQRSIAATSGVDAERMRNGDIDDEAWGYLHEAVSTIAGYNLRIYDRSAPTLEEVTRVARKWVQEHSMRLLFVDYLQRIRHPKAESRIDEVSEVARGLKTLARDLGIPVVCLAQVKAEVDKRNDKRPGLGDIANSDEATREADLIAFLYREEVYSDKGERGIAELTVEKYRHGPTGQFRLAFDAGTMRFRDVEAW